MAGFSVLRVKVRAKIFRISAVIDFMYAIQQCGMKFVPSRIIVSL